MKLIIDIDDKRIKGINLLAKEQDIATPYPTLEQIIANGIPLDKIRAEIEGLTYYWCEVNPKSVIDDVLQIIDKYREGEKE